MSIISQIIITITKIQCNHIKPQFKYSSEEQGKTKCYTVKCIQDHTESAFHVPGGEVVTASAMSKRLSTSWTMPLDIHNSSQV